MSLKVRFGALLGSFWLLLGGLVGAMCGSLDPLGARLVLFRGSWGVLGALLGLLGASWGGLG